jgi:hypothetical protein
MQNDADSPQFDTGQYIILCVSEEAASWSRQVSAIARIMEA